MRGTISAVVAFVVTRVVFSMLGFHYSIFSESFNLEKFTIDIGGFALVYFASYVVLGRILKK